MRLRPHGGGGGGKGWLLPLLLLLPVLRYVHRVEGKVLVDGPIQALQRKQVLMGQRRMLELFLGDLRCEVVWRMQLCLVGEVRAVLLLLRMRKVVLLMVAAGMVWWGWMRRRLLRGAGAFEHVMRMMILYLLVLVRLQLLDGYC